MDSEEKKKYAQKYYLKNRLKIRAAEKILRLKPENKKRHNELKRIRYHSNPELRKKISEFHQLHLFHSPPAVSLEVFI